MVGEIFEYEFVVKETYLDIYSHLNNANYIRIFEEARWDLVQERGFGFQKIQQTQIGPIILSLKADFRKEVIGREKIKVVTQVTEYRKKIGKIKQTMYKQNGLVACEAEFVCALFDLKNRKLMEPTKEWLYAIGWPSEIN